MNTQLPGWLTSTPNKSDRQRVYVVTGEHPDVTGTPMQVFDNSDSANRYAAELTNIIRRDSGLDVREARPDDWESVMNQISEELAEKTAQSCWVAVDARDILP